MLAPILSAALALSYAPVAAAQTVSIQNGLGEHGFGWMFAHGGACHVVMPKHVAGPFPRVTVTTAAPVESASATMIAPFWESIDLAVGIVRGGLDERCTGELEDLEEDRRTSGINSGELLRVTPSGDLERSPLRFMDRGYLTFEGVLEGGTTEVAQGTSGAFVFVRGRPVGMAVTSSAVEGATFIRSGEILIHLRRFLSEQGGAYVEPEAPETANETSLGQRALPLVFHSSSVPPVNPRYAPENMTGPGSFIFAPAQHMRFILGFEDGRVEAVSQLKLISNPAEAQTMPRDVILRWSFDEVPGRFRTWTRGQVARDGIFDTGRGAPRNMRWIEIIVLDAWGGGDIAIDEVAAY